jgi:hypothetical protein
MIVFEAQGFFGNGVLAGNGLPLMILNIGWRAFIEAPVGGIVLDAVLATSNCVLGELVARERLLLTAFDAIGRVFRDCRAGEAICLAVFCIGEANLRELLAGEGLLLPFSLLTSSVVGLLRNTTRVANFDGHDLMVTREGRRGSSGVIVDAWGTECRDGQDGQDHTGYSFIC